MNKILLITMSSLTTIIVELLFTPPVPPFFLYQLKFHRHTRDFQCINFSYFVCLNNCKAACCVVLQFIIVHLSTTLGTL